MDFEIEVYVDGACRANPEGPGGWGVHIRRGEAVEEFSGHEAKTTNNRMELTAAIRALEALPEGCDAVVRTDSQYVMLGITTWLPGWIGRGWRTADRKPVKNEDLWRELAVLDAKRSVRWEWVRGHNGNAGNERADRLATRAIDRFLSGHA